LAKIAGYSLFQYICEATCYQNDSTWVFFFEMMFSGL